MEDHELVYIPVKRLNTETSRYDVIACVGPMPLAEAVRVQAGFLDSSFIAAQVPLHPIAPAEPTGEAALPSDAELARELRETEIGL
jgi:hypothetical protein